MLNDQYLGTTIVSAARQPTGTAVEIGGSGPGDVYASVANAVLGARTTLSSIKIRNFCNEMLDKRTQLLTL